MEASQVPSADLGGRGTLPPDRLAARSGATVGFVDRLAALGLIHRDPSGNFTGADVARVRLALALERSGISLEDFARGVAAGMLSLEFAGGLFEPPRGLIERTQGELLAEVGLSPDWSDRLAVLLGLSPDPGEHCIHEDDAELIGLIGQMVSLGFSEVELRRALQVFGDAMRHISEIESELWEQNIVRPLLEAGLSHQEMLDRATLNSPDMLGAADRLVLLLHRRHLERVVFSNTIEALEAAMEEAHVGRRRKTVEQAIGFLDLSGYTRLTQSRGDELAAEHALQLFDVVRRVANAHAGRPVKFLGDGVMLHFREPPNAVRCSLDLVERAAELGLPPARVGIDAGPLIVREADYFGSTVNVAARISDYARPREVLVTEGAMLLSREDDLAFMELGPTPLKGVAEPVSLYLASRADGKPT